MRINYHISLRFRRHLLFVPLVVLLGYNVLGRFDYRHVPGVELSLIGKPTNNLEILGAGDGDKNWKRRLQI